MRPSLYLAVQVLGRSSRAYRAGHYKCKLATMSGKVAIRVPRLKGARFTTAIIDCHLHLEGPVEEAMIETALVRSKTSTVFAS
ncbi:transposase [Parafannyhessea umbonata]|uniref:transposase n=1 Tax=Parafannyhessea umbonata TaxID=604330 RepID=UPI00359C344A